MKYIMICLFLFVACSLDGQLLDTTEKLYLEAIEKDLMQYELWAEEGYGIAKLSKRIVEKNDFIANYPERIRGASIIELTKGNWKKLFRKHGKSLNFVKLEPIKVIGGQLKITIAKITGRLKRNKLNLAYGDWTDVYFVLNSTTSHWEFDRMETRGI